MAHRGRYSTPSSISAMQRIPLRPERTSRRDSRLLLVTIATLWIIKDRSDYNTTAVLMPKNAITPASIPDEHYGPFCLSAR